MALRFELTLFTDLEDKIEHCKKAAEGNFLQWLFGSIQFTCFGVEEH